MGERGKSERKRVTERVRDTDKEKERERAFCLVCTEESNSEKSFAYDNKELFAEISVRHDTRITTHVKHNNMKALTHAQFCDGFVYGRRYRRNAAGGDGQSGPLFGRAGQRRIHDRVGSQGLPAVGSCQKKVREHRQL